MTEMKLIQHTMFVAWFTCGGMWSVSDARRMVLKWEDEHSQRDI